MKELLEIAVIVIIWVVLSRYILPKFGIPT
jgi:hypothetical protein